MQGGTRRQRGKAYRSVRICESRRGPADVRQLERFRPQDVDTIIQVLVRVFGCPRAKDTEIFEGKEFGHISAVEESGSLRDPFQARSPKGARIRLGRARKAYGV